MRALPTASGPERASPVSQPLAIALARGWDAEPRATVKEDFHACGGPTRAGVGLSESLLGASLVQPTPSSVPSLPQPDSPKARDAF
jgi:hypothetical protein